MNMDDIIDAEVEDNTPHVETETATSGGMTVQAEKPVAVVPSIQEGPGALLHALVGLAQNPDVNPQTVAAWAAIQERMEAREAQRQFNEAFHKMSAVMPRVKKNGAVYYPVDKNKPDGAQKKAFDFAKVEDIDDVIRPILIEHGFHLSFNTTQRVGDGGGVVVHGKLRHVGGHEETATFSLGLDLSGGKSNMQGYASSTSFGQRYCTKLLLNLVFEGDDDNGAKGELTFINPDQIAEITKLVNETETDPKTFLEWVFGDEETHNYAEIPEAKFVAVVNALKGKLRRIKMEAGAKKDG